MALSTATITYDIADLTGVDFDSRRTRVWVTTNIPDGTIADTVGNQVRLGDGRGSLADDGTGSVTVWVPGTGSNPASWQTTLHVDYQPRGGGGRVVRNFGPFTITADANLDDLVAEQAVPAAAVGGDTAVAGFVSSPSSATATALSATIADTVSYTGVSLKRYGIDTATNLTTVLNAAVADGKRHVVIPYRLAAWPLTTQFTYAGTDRLLIEWERGARVTINKAAEAAMDLTNTTLRNAHFTSPYTGPTSAADWPNYALATPGLAGENFQSPARGVIFRDNCRTETRYYHEYATTGIQVLGAHVKLNGPLEFKGMRHRTGWAEGIHIDGGLGGVYDFDCFGSVTVTDSDRAIEVEESAYDATFHGGGRFVNVFPNGYTGMPTQAMADGGTAPDPGSKYANYTFLVGAHSHVGGGGSKNIRYLGDWVLDNCGGGATFVRSSGSNDTDLPRDCYVESLIVRGRGLAPGYLIADLEGYNNRVGTIVIENSGTYVGGSGGTSIRTRFGNGRGCKIDVLRAEKFSLPLVTVDAGADSGSIGRIEASDGKLSGPGYLVDVAGPRFRIGELRARDVAGTLGYVRLQATALDSRVGSQDLSVKIGETIEPIVNLSARADLEVQASPALSAANRAGRYVNLAGGTPNTAGTLGNGTLRLVPVYIPTKITIDRIGGEVTVVGDVGSKVRLGIFTDASGLPGDPVVDATIAGDAVAVAEATITATTLERGWYWIGGVVQLVTTTQPTVRTISSGVPPVYPMLSTTATPLMANTVIGQAKGGVTAALSTFGTTPSTTTAAPRVFVRLV